MHTVLACKRTVNLWSCCDFIFGNVELPRIEQVQLAIVADVHSLDINFTGSNRLSDQRTKSFDYRIDIDNQCLNIYSNPIWNGLNLKWMSNSESAWSNWSKNVFAQFCDFSCRDPWIYSNPIWNGPNLKWMSNSESAWSNWSKNVFAQFFDFSCRDPKIYSIQFGMVQSIRKYHNWIPVCPLYTNYRFFRTPYTIKYSVTEPLSHWLTDWLTDWLPIRR